MLLRMGGPFAAPQAWVVPAAVPCTAEGSVTPSDTWASSSASTAGPTADTGESARFGLSLTRSGRQRRKLSRPLPQRSLSTVAWGLSFKADLQFNCEMG